MIKMVVSDFDKTLIYYRDGFNEYQIDVLKRLKKENIIFVLVTGRNVIFFDNFPELLDVTSYIISSNGSAIYDVKNKKYIFNICINDDSFDELIRIGIDNDYTFVINELSDIYKYGNLKKIDSIDFDVNRQYLSEQIIFYVEVDRINEFIETINRIQGVVINNVHKKTERCSFDINNSSVSKGNGVLWLCNYLGINKEQVIAFGDGENDISMFKVIDNCVSVENACDTLKSYASDITLSYKEYGVFKYIEENILK